jgi:hypothetical protein
MGYKASNNADTTLSESITTTSTAINVATGHGDDFPALGATDWTLITITDKNGAREIIKIIARTGDTMTVGTTPGGEADVGGRAQEGTAALSIAYTDDHSVRCCPTAGLIEAMADYSDQGDLTATPAEIEAVCKGNTATAAELSQLHESGVVKADLENLHDITVEAARINTIGKIKARAYRNAAQDIYANGYTRVAIDTVSFDTDGVVDIANRRIIPNLPGYYIVMGNVRANAVPDGRWVTAAIFKNGALATYGTHVNQGAADYSASSASDLIYMNGTTDYLELCAYNSHSSALDLCTGYSPHSYISIVGPF